MEKIKNLIFKTVEFIKTDIWKIHLKSLPTFKAMSIKHLRIILLSIRGFIEDKCALKASALTFFSLLSIVPLVAAIFGIAKGFGLQNILENQLIGKFPEQESVMSQIVEFSKAMLENTNGGLIAGISVFILFWSVIKLLGNIEHSLNDIWNIKSARPIIRKLTDYFSILLIAPIILIISSGLTIFIKVQLTSIAEEITLLGLLSPVIFFLIKMLPYVMIWILFSLIYMVMPNGKVNFSAGFFAAVVAGTIYQITQWAFITFQVGASSYNAIYGSFSALPLFLVWLQISWFIVLFGAEISFAFQNVETYEFELESKNISVSHKRILSLNIVYMIIKNFEKGDKPLTALIIAERLEMPIRLARQILFEFVDCNLLSKIISEDDKESSYQPAKDIQYYSINYVVEILDKRGSEITILQSEELETISNKLKIFSEMIFNSSENILIKDI